MSCVLTTGFPLDFPFMFLSCPVISHDFLVMSLSSFPCHFLGMPASCSMYVPFIPSHFPTSPIISFDFLVLCFPFIPLRFSFFSPAFPFQSSFVSLSFPLAFLSFPLPVLCVSLHVPLCPLVSPSFCLHFPCISPSFPAFSDKHASFPGLFLVEHQTRTRYVGDPPILYPLLGVQHAEQCRRIL